MPLLTEKIIRRCITHNHTRPHTQYKGTHTAKARKSEMAENVMFEVDIYWCIPAAGVSQLQVYPPVCASNVKYNDPK